MSFLTLTLLFHPDLEPTMNISWCEEKCLIACIYIYIMTYYKINNVFIWKYSDICIIQWHKNFFNNHIYIIITGCLLHAFVQPQYKNHVTRRRKWDVSTIIWTLIQHIFRSRSCSSTSLLCLQKKWFSFQLWSSLLRTCLINVSLRLQTTSCDCSVEKLSLLAIIWASSMQSLDWPCE